MQQELRINTISQYQKVPHDSWLDIIHDERVNIAIHERSIDFELNSFVYQLLRTNFSPFNKKINVSDFEEAFYNHFKIYQSVSQSGFELLKNDIKKLITLFAEISNKEHVKIFFGKVSTDMCKRFHIDMYDMRMLCTYYGPGTEWLENDNINFDVLEDYQSKESIAIDSRKINQLTPFDLAIIKGALHPECKVGALVHKSPQIETLNQERILLRIDNIALSDLL